MSFDPQNELETVLVSATTDPVERPRFLREFLEAQIFVVREGVAPSSEHREGMLQAGEQLALLPVEIEGRDWLPVFSSLPRLQASLSEPKSYLRIKARDFLEITRGADVVLNPGAAYGKYFPSNEVAALLEGNLGLGETRVTQQETQVLLGAPARMPHALIDALTRLFEQRREVRRAWVAHYHEPQSGTPPHTMIGIDVDGDADRLVVDAGAVAQGIDLPDPPVDFYVVRGSDGLADYFHRSAKPFYRRKWLGLF